MSDLRLGDAIQVQFSHAEMRISLEGVVVGFVNGGAYLHGSAVDDLGVGKDEAESEG